MSSTPHPSWWGPELRSQLQGLVLGGQSFLPKSPLPRSAGKLICNEGGVGVSAGDLWKGSGESSEIERFIEGRPWGRGAGSL